MDAPSSSLPNAHQILSLRKRILPGFELSLGYTLSYLCLILFIPLAALALRAAGVGWPGLWAELSNARVLASLRLTFGGALIAATVNAAVGFLIAWVLLRYDFKGRRLLDAIVDLPFALPTAVSGIALTAVFSPNGPLGRALAAIGLQVDYAPAGVVVAMIFVGLPFVARTLQPALTELSRELEDAAASLGARPGQIMRRVIVPLTLPALGTGFSLALARAIGEYGSILFISGNLPMRTEITSLLVVNKLEEYDYDGASAIALVMLVASFLLLLVINLLQKSRLRRPKRNNAK